MKCLSNMRGKNTKRTYLLLIFCIATVVSAVTSVGFTVVSTYGLPAQSLGVDPEKSIADAHETFLIDVVVNVTSPTSATGTGMFGFEYKLFWDPGLINLTSRTAYIPQGWQPPNGFLVKDETGVWPGLPDKLPEKKGLGYHWHSYTCLTGSPFTGDLTLATYNFTVLSRGSCTVDLQEVKIIDNAIVTFITDVPPVAGTVQDGYFSDPYPRALFTYDPTFPIVNETVTFNASASYDPDGTIVSYDWDFGDTTTDTGMIVTHNYTAFGAYNVALTVTDDASLNATAWHIVKIGTVAAFTHSPTLSLSMCDEAWTPNTNVTQTNSTDKKEGAYSQKFDIANNFTTGWIAKKENLLRKNLTEVSKVCLWIKSNTSDGDLTLEFYDGTTLKGNLSIEALTANTWAFIRGEPNTGAKVSYSNFGMRLVLGTDLGAQTIWIDEIFALFPIGTSPLTGQIVIFNATESQAAAPGYIANYTWNFGDGNITVIGDDEPITPIIKHIYRTGGIYNVTLKVADNASNTDTTWHIVKVGRPPKAHFVYSPHSPLVNQKVLFDAYDGGWGSKDVPPGYIVTYTWNFGDGNITVIGDDEPITPFIKHIYRTGGNYNATLTVTDNETLTDSVSNPVPVTGGYPVANFTWSPEEPKVGETVTFNSLSTPDGGSIVNYKWFFGDGTTDTGMIVNNTYTVGGIYNVTLIVDDNEGLSNATTKSITIAKASSTITISASPTTIKAGKNTTISGSITPTRVGVTVTIYYRLTGEVTWNTLTTVPTNATSQYSHSWAPEEDGTYEVKASWLGDASYLEDESSIETVTVEKPPPDYLLYVAVVIIVVVVAAIAVYFLKIRKS